jgi:hypothetical protein
MLVTNRSKSTPLLGPRAGAKTEQANGAEHIRFHFNSIKQELDELVRIAEDNPGIGDGVEACAIENVQRLIRVVEQSLGRLPDRAQTRRDVVSFEVEGEQGERLSIDTPRRARVRKPVAKPDTA